jgi:hypothetical protein
MTKHEKALFHPDLSNLEERQDSGSFRDRDGKVFYADGGVYRALSKQALLDWRRLSATAFFKEGVEAGKIIRTELSAELEHGTWEGVLVHERIPFVSYPYEWSFHMLKDAALLQLDLLDSALKENMAMKDATSYNIQWIGCRPVFIDIPSFEVYSPGSPWIGYLQFCRLFLYPLLLQAYKGIPFHPWLRGSLEGIDPGVVLRMMSLGDFRKKGILADVYLQAKLQERFASSDESVRGEVQESGFRKEMITSNVRRLKRIVSLLNWDPKKSAWSDYTTDNSYSREDEERKTAFVQDAVGRRRWQLVWDLGANTGRYSMLAASQSTYVIAMDHDHLAIDRLYADLRSWRTNNVLPLVINLADPSPGLGWKGKERKALASGDRSNPGSPDLVICLALLHHLVISANVPLAEIMDWLHGFNCALVIEFITMDDPMTKRLLRNRENQYDDFTLDNFERLVQTHYKTNARAFLLSGTRILYFLTPLSQGA